MAKLGVRKVDELVGRIDLIKKKEGLNGIESKIELDRIITPADDNRNTFDPKDIYDFELYNKLDQKLLDKEKVLTEAIKGGKKAKLSVEVENIDRAFGTLIGAEITRSSHEGLKEDTITIECKGAGGQSFGAFIPSGLTLDLTGDSNDYFGKGLSGGKLIIKAPKDAAYDAENNIIVGNVALYGATSGEAYIAGMAGERFCVRNSGAKTVVEGVGEHGCEYMTGGVAVILGTTGKNFAAGMSGGIAYVLDEHNTLYRNLNKEMVLMEKVEHKADKEELKNLLEKHTKYTGSKKARAVLDDFDSYLDKFKKIIPADYKRIVQYTQEFIEQGLNLEEAQIDAFYAATSKGGDR